MPSFYKNGLNFRPTKPYTDKTWIGKSGIRSLLLKRDAHSAFYCQAQKWATAFDVQRNSLHKHHILPGLNVLTYQGCVRYDYENE